MARRLEGKVVVITGATKGIGREIALHLCREGAKIVAGGRNEQEGNNLVVEIESKFNGEAIFIRGDISKVENCRKLIEAALKQFGKIDGLINNAGIFPYYSLMETEEEVFDHVFDVNIKGPFYCSRYAIEAMKKNGGGSIVNIGSTHASGGNPELAAYCCSKGALHSLTKHISKNYARDGIRCNWITVGWVVTPGELDRISEKGMTCEELKAKAEQMIPSGRLQTGEDIAMGIIYLLSDEASQVTGTDLNITGGFSPL